MTSQVNVAVPRE